MGLLGDVRALLGEQGTLKGRPSPREVFRILLTKPGVQALAFYRLYRPLYLKGFTLTAEFLARLNHFLTGAEIDPGADIGSGCRIWHSSGVVIGRGVRIGNGCWLLNNVTLGGRGASGAHHGEPGYPDIGDNVILYTGVSVLGDVRIGFNSVI
ncbi:MAG: serine O-acetyltransferase, partial [Candidatus Geothermincolia bacterium]